MAPFYVLFAKDLLKYECVLHIHSKKSLYTGGEKANWRHEALDGVLKSEDMVKEALRLMRSEHPGSGACIRRDDQDASDDGIALAAKYSKGKGFIGKTPYPVPQSYVYISGWKLLLG